jgi:hypothetical protein
MEYEGFLADHGLNLAIFVIGLLLGYALRAWISRVRRRKFRGW